jgi:hypothetical protein
VRKLNSADLNALGDYTGDNQITNLDIQLLLDAVAAAGGGSTDGSGASAATEMDSQVATAETLAAQPSLFVPLTAAIQYFVDATPHSSASVSGVRHRGRSQHFVSTDVNASTPWRASIAVNQPSGMLRSRQAVGTMPIAPTVLDGLFANWE